MSGWLGAINYGVIVANDVDQYLMKRAHASGLAGLDRIGWGSGSDWAMRAWSDLRV